MYVKSAIFYRNFRVWLFIPVNGLIFRESINNINRCVLNCSGEKREEKREEKRKRKRKVMIQIPVEPKWKKSQSPSGLWNKPQTRVVLSFLRFLH